MVVLCRVMVWCEYIDITFGYCYMTHTLRGYVGFGVFHGGSLESYRMPSPCGPTLYTRTVRIKRPYYVAYMYYKFVKVKCLSADLWAIMMLHGLFFRINVPNIMFTSPLNYRGNLKPSGFWCWPPKNLPLSTTRLNFDIRDFFLGSFRQYL